ncbi:MAG: glycosyltransferase, partial [Cyanobacteria bacterium P01_H01_bin.105]
HKVHEAAAHGLPVVTTPLIAKQLQWQPDTDILVAKQPEDFSRQCIQLYQDEALWTHLRENALKKVKRECSPQQFSQKLAMILRDACRHEVID